MEPLPFLIGGQSRTPPVIGIMIKSFHVSCIQTEISMVQLLQAPLLKSFSTLLEKPGDDSEVSFLKGSGGQPRAETIETLVVRPHRPCQPQSALLPVTFTLKTEL